MGPLDQELAGAVTNQMGSAAFGLVMVSTHLNNYIVNGYTSTFTGLQSQHSGDRGGQISMNSRPAWSQHLGQSQE